MQAGDGDIGRRRMSVVYEGSQATAVLSRVYFACGRGSRRGLHFSLNEVTKREEKQTHRKCLSSPLAHERSQGEKKGTTYVTSVLRHQKGTQTLQ